MRGVVSRVVGRWLHANAAGAGTTPTEILTRGQIAGKRRRALIWGVGVGVGTGAAVAGGMAYREHKRRLTILNVILNESEETSFRIPNKPPFSPSRSVKYAADPTGNGLNLTLYQYQTCPFCCKVRATLDYFGISYNVVEVNPVLRTQLKWSEKYKKVPILIIETPEGEILQLNDSSMIVSVLYSYLINASQFDNKLRGRVGGQGQSGEVGSEQSSTVHNIAKFYPTVRFTDEKGMEQADIMNKYFLMFGDTNNNSRNKDDIIAERKWRTWADSVYVHTLSPNIYRTMSESIDSFKYFDKVGEWDKNFKAWERTLVIYVGAFAMWMVGKRLQKRHNLKEDVRQSLYDESNHWMKNIQLSGGEFMGGAKPNLADLAVYGVLSSIEGCEAFQDLNQNSRIVKDWYYIVQRSLQQPVVVEHD